MKKIIRTFEEASNSGDCDIYYQGKVHYFMNPLLLNEKQAWNNLSAIVDAHTLKLCIYDQIINTTNKKELKDCATQLQEIEFYLQELWGFKRDARYHKFWQYPKCTCPVIDNEDNYPHQSIINQGCPLHGK